MFSKHRVLKEGSVIMNGFGNPVKMPEECQSPYVTPSTSPDNSPMIGADGGEMLPNMKLK